ncbi:glycosyltransferase family 34 protein [Aureobasidium subglaciale EXF-2481]|uniref:Glycosyltransferase family 34 protein n=1 Tax=Aureobasidium subglaciale (strain EXF-2481) TaxID=1043005 RepID=A0A074Y687_AURSE|nr:glycosyltransferase family 34 protein [Aureobasidium subglaciale EXF-2481]KEQ93288.1 glycosyltransferase family 34 protein [Aureobasidium subglaciale EXF-2481]
MYGGAGAQCRLILLVVLISLGVVTLLQSLQTTHSIHDIPLSIRGHKFGGAVGRKHGSAQAIRIKKVTALFGEPNYLYEGAIATHERHNALHGYQMQVLRQRIHASFLAKPAYLMSVLVEELNKPWDERMQWLAWVDPDTLVLNQQVPLELFVPPLEEEINLIATHDDNGYFNGGVFFLRVDTWSLEFLIQVLAVPLTDRKHHVSLNKDHAALEQIMESQRFRNRVTYQPRIWYNAFDSNKTYEGEAGGLMVHLLDLGGDKWARMDKYLGNVTSKVNPHELPLEQTPYEEQVQAFWKRMRDSRRILKEAREKEKGHDAIKESARRLRFALEFETDNEVVMRGAYDRLLNALYENK